MSLSNSSSNSNYLSEQKCENEDKDFLIDDDYNDQQELTFYGQDDSLDEIFLTRWTVFYSVRKNVNKWKILSVRGTSHIFNMRKLG